MNPTFPHAIRSLLALFPLLIAGTAAAETRHIALPSYRISAGKLVEVPVMLDNAAGLAGLRIQLNYDPAILSLEHVQAGPLGGAFDFDHETTEGVVRITLARGDALAGGAGRLASLRFRTNPALVVDSLSELTIADVSLSDATGVIDLRQKDDLEITNGELSVSARSNLDNTGSGLPDWWELKYGLDPFADNALRDPDGDGLNNLFEYAFGGHPKVADAGTRGMRHGRFELNGRGFMTLRFFRRTDDPLLTYQLEESRDLSQWWPLPIPDRQIGHPVDQGDGTEFVEVSGSLPMDGPEEEGRGFLRLRVNRTE